MIKHIKTKVIILFLSVIAIVFSLFYLIYDVVDVKIMNTQTEEATALFENLKTSEIEKLALQTETLLETLSSSIESTHNSISQEQYETILKTVVQNNSYIDAIAVVFEPNLFNENDYYSSYAIENKDDVDFYLSNNKELYSFYSNRFIDTAKLTRKISYTGVYRDEKTGVRYATCTMPIVKANNEYIGSIISFINISHVSDVLNSFNHGNNQVIILNSDGEFIAHSENVDFIKDSININDENFEDKHDVINTILKNESGIETYEKDSTIYSVYYSTITGFNWKLAIISPQSSLMLLLNELYKYTFFIFVLIMAFLAFLILKLINNHVEKPIKVLIEDFENESNNEQNAKLLEKLTSSNDELGTLGKKFNSIKEHQSELENTLTKKRKYIDEIEQKNELLFLSEQDLLRTLHYNTTILEAIPDLVFVVSKDCVINDIKGTSSYEFMKLDSFIGETLLNVIPNKLSARMIIDKVKHTLNGNLCDEMDFFFTKEGIEYYFNLRFSMSTDDTAIIICRDLNEIQNKAREVEYLNNFDKLTGLHNRSYGRDRIEALLQYCPLPLTLISADINGLKLVNSSFGFDVGDKLLIEFSNILKTVDINIENAMRINGGQFLIALPSKDMDFTNKIIEDLKIACEKHYVNDIELSVSFGASILTEKTQSIETALSEAEEQMLINKRSKKSITKNNTIKLINTTLHAKIPREQLHSDRVSQMCEKMAKAYGFSKEKQALMRTAGLFHDIGKIGIPEYILDKEGGLSAEELFEMRKHPEIGYRILMAAGDMQDVAEIVVYHHEKWDGSGYPNQLKGVEIPIEARMIAIIDAYDAMQSDRSYRKGLPQDVILKELEKFKGIQFDPQLVDLFISQVL